MSRGTRQVDPESASSASLPLDQYGVVETFGLSPGGPDTYCEPTDWLSDRLFVTVHTARGGGHLERGGRQESRREAVAGRALQRARRARRSPDGRWIAYVSDESGRPEVSVRTLVGSARRIVLSPDGGNQPVWRKDGGELFFVESRRPASRSPSESDEHS